MAIADFPFLTFNLSSDGYNAYLTTARGPGAFAELASTPNQAAVANALDSATSSLAWQQVVGATEAQARAAFSSLSNASIHASAAGVLSEQSHFLRDAVLDRLRQDFPVGPAADPDSVLTYGAARRPRCRRRKGPPPSPPLGPVYAVWAQGLGGWGSLGGNSNVARTNDSIGGVISGVDVTFNRMFRLGFAGGYSQSNFNSVNIPASGSADSYHFAVYGGWQDGPWALRGGGSVSWNDLNTSRQVTAVNLGGAQTSELCRQDVAGLRRGRAQFRLWPGLSRAIRQCRLCACRRRRERVGSRGDERIDELRHDLHDARRARLLHPAGGPHRASDARLALCVRRRHAAVEPRLPAGRKPPSRSPARRSRATRSSPNSESTTPSARAPRLASPIPVNMPAGPTRTPARRASPCGFEQGRPHGSGSDPRTWRGLEYPLDAAPAVL